MPSMTTPEWKPDAHWRALNAALDRVSYEWLVDTHPQLVEALERQVSYGATPDQIRRQVMAYTNRPELARRCQQAASYLCQQAASCLRALHQESE